MITQQFLIKLFNETDEEWLGGFVEPLNKTFARFSINTPLRIAGFLAQVGHESGDFSVLEENLNYRAERLRVVFKKYFTTDQMAAAYARNPEKIANRVYANRMGNGDEASGDGWRYRGRGLVQLTGKNNYSAFAAYMGMNLADVPDYLEAEEGATMASGWFWNSRNLNAPADRGDIVTMTQLVNGGQNGIDHRRQLYSRAKSLLGVR